MFSLFRLAKAISSQYAGPLLRGSSVSCRCFWGLRRQPCLPATLTAADLVQLAAWRCAADKAESWLRFMQVLQTLQTLVNALGTQSTQCYPVLLPVLRHCTDISQVRSPRCDSQQGSLAAQHPRYCAEMILVVAKLGHSSLHFCATQPHRQMTHLSTEVVQLVSNHHSMHEQSSTWLQTATSAMHRAALHQWGLPEDACLQQVVRLQPCGAIHDHHHHHPVVFAAQLAERMVCSQTR